MISSITKSPRVLALFFKATVSYFILPVVASAATAFETRDELKTAVDEYCAGGNSIYG